MESLENPPEAMLRDFFTLVGDLDSSFAKLLETIIRDEYRSTSYQDVIVATEALFLAAGSMRLCKYGFKKIHACLSEPSHFSNLMSLVNEHQGQERTQYLRDVLGEARLIPRSMYLTGNHSEIG
jgi:hypothetical protein